MSIQVQVDLRTQKLGGLIRDARLAARKSLSKCARLAGVESDILQSWEEGRSAPSLPELEVMAYVLQRPLQHFWGDGAMPGDAPQMKSINLPALIGIRQRMVGALLRQQRKNANLSLRALSEQSGIPAGRLNAYEMGERPIPLPELEGLVNLCSGQIETLFDQKGPVGQWMLQQKAVQNFLQLPSELQDFASKPVNRPYLELALQVSNMSSEKLRSLVESLLGKFPRNDK
jgi:transcriptional regulator with XRE-family HTH domain